MDIRVPCPFLGGCVLAGGDPRWLAVWGAGRSWGALGYQMAGILAQRGSGAVWAACVGWVLSPPVTCGQPMGAGLGWSMVWPGLSRVAQVMWNFLGNSWVTIALNAYVSLGKRAWS